MNDVGAVPTAAGETLEIFWMRSYHHNVGSHVKLPAGRARNPLTHIHVGNAKPVDVLRSSGNTVRHPLKENTIETSRVVMLGTGWRTRQAGPFTRAPTENSKFAALAGRIIHDRCAVGYELWCGPQCVPNFFKVRYRQVFSGGLGARCQRSEKTKYNQPHFTPQEECSCHTAFILSCCPMQRHPRRALSTSRRAERA